MAISTTAAILGSAVIGAGASAVASGNNSKAIQKSTDAQTSSNAQSNALQASIYNQNKETLSPFVDRGNTAGGQINALLGLGGTQPAQQTQVQPNALTQFKGGQPAGAGYGIADGQSGLGTPFYSSGRRFNPAAYGDATGDIKRTGIVPSQTYGVTLPSQGGPVSAQSGPQGQTAQGAAENAFDIFRNSTGYRFRVNEGMDAVNSGYAGSGILQSGAALKGLDDYRQNMASAEFGNYMGYLGQQQGTGLSAAGAQAGVGLSYANNVSNLNQANANALSNAAVANANNSNALIGGISGNVTNAIGYLGGR